MSETVEAQTVEARGGGYRYFPGVSQYSCGVAALQGFRIERVQFANPVPLAQGFERIERFLKTAARPLTSFCACELRSPAPFTEEGFRAFNESYIGVLEKWGLMAGRINPVARSNVCPKLSPPATPSFHAFAFTAPVAGSADSFIVAGSGESVEGKANYRDHTVRLGDTSPEGMREKAKHVHGEMERRMAALGGTWATTTAVQLYTVHDVFPFLESELGRRGILRAGLTWQFCRPPVVDLEYEMDCRRVHVERVLEG
jgi:hypothetical protein